MIDRARANGKLQPPLLPSSTTTTATATTTTTRGVRPRRGGGLSRTTLWPLTPYLLLSSLLLLVFAAPPAAAAAAPASEAVAESNKDGRQAPAKPMIVVGSLQLTVSSSAIMQDVEAQKGFKDRFSAVLGVDPHQVNMMFSLTSVVPRRLDEEASTVGDPSGDGRALSENAWLVLVRYRIQIRDGQSPEKILAAARSAAPGKLVILSSLVYKISIAQSSGPALKTLEEVESQNDLEHVSPDFPREAPTSTRTETSTSTRTTTTLTATSTSTWTSTTILSDLTAATGTERPGPTGPTTTVTYVPTTTTLGGLFMADSSVETVGVAGGSNFKVSGTVAYEREGLLQAGVAERAGLLFAALALTLGCFASLCPGGGGSDGNGDGLVSAASQHHRSSSGALMQEVGSRERRHSQMYHEGTGYR